MVWWARATALLVINLFLCSVYQVDACGVTQHNVIAHKALSWFYPGSGPNSPNSEFMVFRTIIENNQDTFQAGAAFPDWGYAGIIGESDASEAAHWPPFTLSFSLYLIENCGSSPSNYTSSCEQLVSFLFGVVSHQTADVLWHDLRIAEPTQQGFIQSMGNTDFFGSFSDAHSVADGGADFIVSREFDLSWILREWYVPAGNLTLIYQQMGQQVTPEKIIEGNLLLYAEVHAVKEFGELLYPYAARESAFLADELLHYWLGGLDDNAYWTQQCWYGYLMNWVTSDSFSEILEYPLCVAQASFIDSKRKPTTHPIIEKVVRYLIEENAFTIDSSENGVRFGLANDFDIICSRAREIIFGVQKDYLVSSCPNAANTLPFFAGDTANAYFSHSISSGDINHDGIKDMIIGAPGWSANGTSQTGAIFIVQGDSSLSQSVFNKTLDTPFLIGTDSRDRFGWASAVLDVNKDGWNDLVVSSPGNDAADLEYKGKLSVFFGTGSGAFNPVPDVLITTKFNYTNLADSLYTYDFDGDNYLDLLIQAPFAANGETMPQQVGKIFLLLSDASIFNSGATIDLDSNATWTLNGYATNNLFGSHVTVVNKTTSLGHEMLIVGAPTHATNDNSEVGAIYGYDLTKLMNGKSQNASLEFSMRGTNKWDKVGFSFAVGSLASYSSVLGISAPGRKTGAQEEQFGTVYYFDLSTLQGDQTLTSATNLIFIQGDQEFARFGSQCMYDENSSPSSWWVSQPRRHYGETNPEAGAIFRWNDDRLPSTPKDPIKSADECWSATTKRIRFGEIIHFVDLDDNGISDVIMGAPRDGDLNGACYILFR